LEGLTRGDCQSSVGSSRPERTIHHPTSPWHMEYRAQRVVVAAVIAHGWTPRLGHTIHPPTSPWSRGGEVELREFIVGGGGEERLRSARMA